MATPTPHQLVQTKPISCHAWNGDRNQIAFSPNSKEVFIYEKSGSTWNKIHTLTEHDQRVLSIDWAPQSNLIVTCGEDRNAYVWTLTDGKWKPGLVVLRINRAATCVKWSPCEKKFAIGSGARVISVCHFQEENDWWLAKHIKSGIRSTITCLEWHPNSTMLAAGSSDFQTRIFSAAIKGLDKRPPTTCWADQSKFRSFGSVLHTFSTENDGWVHDVAFSPSGDKLAWVSHSSSISFVDGNSIDKVQTLFESHLPQRAIIFSSEDKVIAAGHDCVPNEYTNNGGNWKFNVKLETKKASGSSGESSAMSRFQQLDKAAQSSGATNLNSTHQNAINQLSVVKSANNVVTEFASSGLDGKLVMWKIN